MPKIALLALEGCCPSSLAGPIDAMHIANAHSKKQLGEGFPSFEWQLISPGGKPIVAAGGLPLAAQGTLGKDSWDAVLIPGIYYSGMEVFSAQLDQWDDVYRWLRRQWERGAILAATCTGTFLLAETGLLNSHKATTAWWAERHFRNRYPEVVLDSGQVLTESGQLICTGAITSVLQLAIKLIERFASPSIASLTAKTMLIDVGQTSQSLYVSLDAFNHHSDRLVFRAQHWLQQHLRKKVSLEALAGSLAVSQRTLIRRFKTAIDVTPQRYLQILRIEAAKQLLETSSLSLLKIAEQVGYGDEGAFGKVFRVHSGMTPRAYRERFR